jgi:broad specificity phosphatase PhoE
VANEQKLVTGDFSDPLSEEGISQAQSLHTFVKKQDISGDLYVTSNWLRAQQTAKIIWPDKNWIFDERVGETNAGIASNLAIDKFLEKNPDFYSCYKNKYPSGESHLDLNARVVCWYKEMLESKHNTVVLVGHSGPICCILQNALGLGMEVYPSLIVHNASLSILEYEKHSKKIRTNIKCVSMLPESRFHEFSQNRFLEKND